jgi:hypothetical protein
MVLAMVVLAMVVLAMVVLAMVVLAMVVAASMRGGLERSKGLFAWSRPSVAVAGCMPSAWGRPLAVDESPSALTPSRLTAELA